MKFSKKIEERSNSCWCVFAFISFIIVSPQQRRHQSGQRIFALSHQLLAFLTLRPGDAVLERKIVTALHRRALWVLRRVNSERQSEVLREYPQMIHIAGINQILLGREYLYRNAAAAEKLIFDLLFDSPRNVAGIAIHAADGNMLYRPPGSADLAAAHGEAIVRLSVSVHLRRPGSAVDAKLLMGGLGRDGFVPAADKQLICRYQFIVVHSLSLTILMYL